MEASILNQIQALKEAPIAEIRQKYVELFGQEPTSTNPTFLWRKIVFRTQEIEFGGLSEDARKKLDELIQKYDPANNVLLRPESSPPSRKKSAPDRRLPIPGSVITKMYKGRKVQVKVLENGFEYQGKIYRTLSAVASDIGGQHWNGYLFFGL